jgi:serine protease inhibitor
MKSTFCRMLILVTAFSVVACSDNSISTSNGNPVPVPELPVEVAKGNQGFAWDLYGKLKEKDGNLFYSPFSISTALAMTSTGAKGETLKEMLSTLHLPEGDATHAGMGQLLAHLAGSDLKKNGYEVTTANALWGQKGESWLPDFLGAMKKNYRAGLSDVDFASATEAARQTINAWVEKQTRDKIRELLKPGILTSNTRLVLTNAIYFKGNWAKQFQPKQTNDQEFTFQDGKKEKVPMMHQTGEFRFFANEELKVLEMPYAGDNLSMVLFLPVKKDGLPELEKQLTSENADKWLGGLHKVKDLQVAVPKFKMESEFKLNDVLGSLGMKLPFDALKADFSGMTGQTGLFLSAVVHKAFVEVNEEGTEAAAATGAVVAVRSAPVQRPTFVADHPFVFAIRDTKTQSVLFVGRVSNPK